MVSCTFCFSLVLAALLLPPVTRGNAHSLTVFVVGGNRYWYMHQQTVSSSCPLYMFWRRAVSIIIMSCNGSIQLTAHQSCLCCLYIHGVLNGSVLRTQCNTCSLLTRTSVPQTAYIYYIILCSPVSVGQY